MLYSIIGMLVIIFDQVVKFWVDKNIRWTDPIRPLIPGIVSLVRVQNDGAAFSFLSGGSARIAFIIITAIFAVLVVLALATNFVSGRFGRWCLVFITAGGLANLIDRVRFGYVIDMFKVELFDFAVFNVADIFITVFCIAFIIYILFGGEKEKEPDADEFDTDDYEDEDRPSRVRAARSKAAVSYEDEEDMPRRSAKRSRPDDEDEAPRKRQAAPVRRKPAAEDEEDSPRPRTRRAARPVEDDSAEEAPVRTRRPSPDAERKPAPARRRPAADASEAPAAKRPAPRKAAEEEARVAAPARKPAAKDEPAVKKPVRRAAPVASANDDPFAEWEKANARVNATRAKAEEVASSSGSVTGEVDAFSEYLAASKPSAKETKTAPAKKPVASAPAAPVKASKPALSSLDDFDLDSILDEFK